VATGIEVVRFGKKVTLKAKKEVVLSAGAIGSPQILLLSGIGSKDHLQSVGVPLVKDLPGVGQNMQDHLMAALTVVVPRLKPDETGKNQIEQDWTGMNAFDSANPLKYFQYLAFGKGPLASSGIAVGGFVHSGLDSDERPDIQLHTFPGHLTLDFDLAFRKAGNVADKSYEAVCGDIKEA
jgi:choline dehydrogenase-like flavoprotein